MNTSRNNNTRDFKIRDLMYTQIVSKRKDKFNMSPKRSQNNTFNSKL